MKVKTRKNFFNIFLIESLFQNFKEKENRDAGQKY